MKILIILIAAYAFIELTTNSIYIDVYSDLRQASPFEHCVAAFSGTPSIAQCKELKLEGDK